MNKLLLIPSLLILLLVTGCDTAKTARDTIATDYGFIVTVQAQNLDSCRADSTQSKCQLINRAIAIHNSAITALNLYCEGTPVEGDAFYSDGGACSPVAGTESRLRAAIAELDTIVADIKLLLR